MEYFDNKIKKQLVGLVKMMRPKQWVKNTFVLAPLLFTGQFLLPSAASKAFLALIFFCLASSATYIANDIHDIRYDRRHPKKSKTRPIAAGIVSVPLAVISLVVVYTVLLLSWFFVPHIIIGVVIGYILLNLAYTFVLKNQPVLDIFIIAIGFVLRVYAGTVALKVTLSGWMFVTTLCLALYLAALKRRKELIQSGTSGRRVLEKYSVPLVACYAEMSATGAIIFYSKFVMTSRPDLIITIPLVLYGLYRYWYVVDILESGDSPTDALFADWQLMITVVLWVCFCGWTFFPVRVIGRYGL